MAHLEVVPDLPAEGAEKYVPIETIGQLLEDFRVMVVSGYVEEAALRMADWARTYADVPLPDPKR